MLDILVTYIDAANYTLRRVTQTAPSHGQGEWNDRPGHCSQGVPWHGKNQKKVACSFENI